MKTVIINRSNKPASPLVSMESIYNVSPLFASSKPVGPWVYYKKGDTIVNENVELPYSVNRIDGHSANYAVGKFTFTSTITIHKLQPTYLWFDHADQSAEVYIGGTLVTKHWGGYNAFFIDITDYIQLGTNDLSVILYNNKGNYLAPASGDFNRNATLGKVKILTSPVLPSTKYGYDGFHINATVTDAQAVMTIKTTIPTYADVILKVNDEEFNYVERKFGKGDITFTVTIDNPHLWDGTLDPHLYDVTLEIYYNEELNLVLKRPYGLRYFDYVWNDETIDGYDSEHPYTGFLLNGHPYLLRGVCTHHDLVNKANALTVEDINNDFDIITELGANFLRLAHYPHPKQVYDYCDRLGIIVQTEAPWVNASKSDMPNEYWERLGLQITDMVNEHYNHPCILFWGVGNEINSNYTNNTEGKDFVKGKIEGYRTQIRSLLPGAWVGYTVSHSTDNGLGLFNNPTVDWIGNNIYVGWYISQNSNDPSSYINTRINNNDTTPTAYSEYGCGGSSTCHSTNYMSTTTRGNNPRHDIEYMMWLHEGHIAAIKNIPQLLFTSQWQLFDIAVNSRQEGYKVCLDDETVTDNDDLKFLNNKGLVERDHKTKKDPFYLYKAWWNTTDKFVHICQKNFTKVTDRVIKCYTNETGNFSLYVNPTGENDTPIETITPTNNILEFTATTFNAGDVIVVTNGTVSDTFTFEL